MPHLPQSRLHPQARAARVAPRSPGAPLRTLITMGATALAIGLGLGAAQRAHAAWEPSKPVEFVVPAGTGGGADQMARFIQGVVAKNNLMKQPMVVVNKGGGAGAFGERREIELCHGAVGDDQFGRDRAVAESLCHQREHLAHHFGIALGNNAFRILIQHNDFIGDGINARQFMGNNHKGNSQVF